MPWVKGQSGNPKGRHGGKRERISAAYLNDAYAVWRQHGRAALEAAARDEPAQFVATISRLLPKDTQLTVTHELSQSFHSALLAAQHTSPSVTVINGSAEHVSDDANALIPLNTQRSED